MTGRFVAAGLSLSFLACAPQKPPRWEEGGAPLVVPAARWDRHDEDPVEIRPDGHVLEDGDLLFVIDRVGRVADEDYEAVAVLFPNGRLAGTDHRELGHVGVSNAAPPDRAEAWLSVMPDGTVVYFDRDGERLSRGKWHGCTGAALRTCTLVTHLLTVRDYVNDRGSGVSVGVGIGIGL